MRSPFAHKRIGHESSAQEAITRQQRDADLIHLASLYAKNYGPYEWKRDVLGFDPILVNLENNFNEVLKAYNENRGRSAPVSLNSTGSLTLNPTAVTYNKPLLVLTDEFSASGGDAIIQDNHNTCRQPCRVAQINELV